MEKSTGPRWVDFAGDAQSLDPEQFAARYPHPVLILWSVSVQANSDNPDRFKTQVAAVSSLRTAMRNQATKAAEAETTEAATLGAVFIVEKRPGNAYPSRISLGGRSA
jgi:hypothetical protein